MDWKKVFYSSLEFLDLWVKRLKNVEIKLDDKLDDPDKARPGEGSQRVLDSPVHK